MAFMNFFNVAFLNAAMFFISFVIMTFFTLHFQRLLHEQPFGLPEDME